MINDIKEYFRYRIYENSRILVNNLKDVIEETKVFLDKKIYPYLKENDERIIISDIELVYEDEKIVWRIIEKNELNDKPTLKLDLYNIKELFMDEEYVKDIKEKYSDYPKELCGVSLYSFMEAISYFVYQDELIETLNVCDICMLSNNENNNIVYEIQE